MKKIILLALLSTSAFARSFTPTSGMKFFCNDSVSNYNYVLEIVDIGDEEAFSKIIKPHNAVVRKNGIFIENSEGSEFHFENLNASESFSIIFPNNDLNEGYYQDRGDSRSLSCKLL